MVDSRLVADGSQTRRRRECLGCNERFTTFETAELSYPLVVKQNGQRQPFIDEKLRSGLERSLEKRPVSLDQLESALSRIRSRIRNRSSREIHSRIIGDYVMDELRQLDEVAYVRFASVYRRFQDVAEFRTEIDRLSQTVTGAIPHES